MKYQSTLICFDREYRQFSRVLVEQLASKKPLPIIINGLNASASNALCIEAIRDLSKAEKGPALILVPHSKEGRWLTGMLESAGLRSAYYPVRDFIFDFVSASHDIERERLFVLSKLEKQELDVVVSTPTAALQMTIPPDLLASHTLSLSCGAEMPPLTLAKRLGEMGYVHVDTVESVGQFTRRGGIIDVYGAGSPPLRIEFFGDEIDRIGQFDPETQRVTGEVETASILPAREVLTTPETLAQIATHIKHNIKKSKEESTTRALEHELAAISGETDLYTRDKYISILYPDAYCLFDHFSQNMPIFLQSSSEAEESLAASERMQNEIVESLIERGLIGGKYAHYCKPHTYLETVYAHHVPVYLNQFAGVSMSMACAGLFGFRCRQTASYRDNFRQLCDDLKDLIKTGYRTLVLCPSPLEVDPLLKALDDVDIPAMRMGEDTPLDEATLPFGAVGVGVGACLSGFDLPNPKVALLSMGEDGGANVRRKSPRIRRAKVEAGQTIRSSAELKVGDFIVHQTYGIGRFVGIQNTRVAGVAKDYITIQYAGTDQLLVPADRLEYISKYIGAGADDGTVKLTKMGGTEWGKMRSRAKASAKALAKDLIALYAARQRMPGFAFPPDDELEKEFDQAFEFIETEPQMIAISEIKQDMMRPTPMDRLLCGDVGFGKTEVAFRAAFKAICAGKQVALLVPTTILALQHFQTALSRMRGFPVSIEMLSRLRSPSEQTKILRRLKRGDIDMLIGTHSLLGKKVEWKDLGLLIVDEEQRFGVAQKERLKQMSQGVDVLTLSATPIPRTLHMAMSGIRDMSILDEAPADRFPVQTYVLEHDAGFLEEAMRKELRRGGQVLYLHNRTETIDLVASRIAKAIPDARVTWAHGQMEKDELEQIWQALVRGDIDILVCTTIVETGVDLPNANTLIIEDADRMGLSQLHQLRGRVGRSGRRAYAYFTFRPGKALTDIARKRLDAIREYTEFGAGFRVAMRDLEIRGAGNLLGAEQHGNIDAVGYDLYVRLLQEAILEEQGQTITPPFECTVDILSDALIPETYIPSASHRMDMYKKISHIATEHDRSDILDEFCDRFGDPPPAVVRLLYVALIRARGSKHHMSKIEQKEGEVRIVCEKIDLPLWSELFATQDNLRMGGGLSPAVFLRLKRGEDAAKSTAALLLKYDALSEADKNKQEGEG